MKIFPLLAFFGLGFVSLFGDVKNEDIIEVREIDAQASSLLRSSTTIYSDLNQIDPISHRNPFLNASAHALGAIGAQSLVAFGTLAGVAVGRNVYNDMYDGIIFGGLIGAGAAFAGSLVATHALGGSKAAIAAGCLGGIAIYLYTNEPAIALLSTMTISGTIASIQY